jgi:hypothetical protein
MLQQSSELDILLSELKDMREDVKTRVEQRNYMTEVLVVLVSGIAAAAATASTVNPNSLLILGVVPFVTAFFIFLIKASYNRHRCLTIHLQKIEQRINNILNGSNSRRVDFWETSFKETEKTNRRKAYNSFNIGTVFICNTIFTGYVCLQFVTWVSQQELLLGIPMIILVVSLLCLYWVIGMWTVKSSWITQADIEELVLPPLPPTPPPPFNRWVQQLINMKSVMTAKLRYKLRNIINK